MNKISLLIGLAALSIGLVGCSKDAANNELLVKASAAIKTPLEVTTKATLLTHSPD